MTLKAKQLTPIEADSPRSQVLYLYEDIEAGGAFSPPLWREGSLDMPAIRTDHKAGFTVVDNGIFKGKLSLKACGLLCTLMGFPDGWRFSECGLEAMLEKDGRASIRSAIKELEAAGYLTRKRIRKEGKAWESEWTFSDRPLGTWSEKPALEKPMLENRTTNKSTEVLNKNQSSTEQCDIPTSLDEVKQFLRQIS